MNQATPFGRSQHTGGPHGYVASFRSQFHEASRSNGKSYSSPLRPRLHSPSSTELDGFFHTRTSSPDNFSDKQAVSPRQIEGTLAPLASA